MPMKKIAKKLGVSPASVHLWTADIRISDEHRSRNIRTARAECGRRWAAVNRAKRLGYQAEGRTKARDEDPLHQAGCMLYWAEGSKERGGLTFSNSDRAMVAFFSRFLRGCFGIAVERLSVRLNVYTTNGLSVREIEDSWLEALELPRSCLRAHTLDHFPTSSSGQKKNKLPYGVCTLRLFDTRIAQHIYGAIQEYGGFDEPRWLDGPPRSRQQVTGSPDQQLK